MDMVRDRAEKITDANSCVGDKDEGYRRHSRVECNVCGITTAFWLSVDFDDFASETAFDSD